MISKTEFEKTHIAKGEEENRKKAVVFDLDGTLLYTLEDLKNATNYALKQSGMPERTLDEVRRFVGNGVRLLMERAVPQGADNPKFEETFALFKEYYDAHCND
ncbi:MAG: HAD hydrolase-like protein, partial [Lachnospiraceae bacterium]|nr:HAD hydrolase-like protein [Lachnospiraceae bacterium]